MSEDLVKVMEETVAKLCQPNKGILAADESIGTIGKRFESIGLENTHENRWAYRDMLFNAKYLNEYISGVITYEETLFDKDEGGKRLVQPLFDAGIVVGIKTDMGLEKVPPSHEYMTKGLDDLAERSKKYFEAGARFAKWRCVYEIDDFRPTMLSIDNNAKTLARYARISQDCGLVPIIEPEVLMGGSHTIEECYDVTKEVLAEVYYRCHLEGVDLNLTLLKPNMVRHGTTCKDKVSNLEVAKHTVAVLQDTVPVAVPGIVFLSGGASEEEATECLRLINSEELDMIRPWRLSFSFGRALQNSALKVWNGQNENRSKAQLCLMDKAADNSGASGNNFC